MKATDKTKILFQQALQLDDEARTLLIENISDDDIKSQVETLLADEDQLNEYLLHNQTNQPCDTSLKRIKPGAQINRIRIIKLLGQGGMGSVYLGFDEKLERQVAVKSIRPEHLTNPATAQRFEREAQIMSKINHPSICQLYDYMETPEGDFLVMEYIKGQPLYKVPMTDADKLSFFGDLAAALAVAHEHGIVHRDLKPDNIMVTDKGQLKVLDFGIAQSLSTPKTQFDNTMIQTDLEKKPSLTQQGSLVGTIRYMSPEQAQGQVIETPSDMYALGIIAQEIFTHQNAYEISEKAQLLTDVQQGRKQAINGLPSAIINLLDQLTTLNPTDRPTALQCVERINTIINAPTVKRKKIMVIGAITVGLLLLFVLIWQWQQRQHQTIINKQVQQYEAQIEALTTKAEQIYVLPIHPVNAEISAVLQQGDALYQKILNDDKLSNTAKSRLQGIIMLKVEYFSEAITLLKNGQAENQLMADAWVRLYIEKATEYSELHGFEQTMKDENLQNNYLRPALKYIELAEQDSGQTDPLYHAFILSQTQSFDAGLTAINKLLETERWNKDAVNLKALILYAMMAHAQEQGEWQLAKDYALLTAATYHRSTEMARSYPPSYNSLCLTYLNLLSDAIQRSGVDVKLFTNQSISACKNSLITQPNNSYPKHLLSRIFLLKALWQIDSGINADESLTQAQHWSDQTNALSELYIRNWNQALILTIQSKQQLFKGQSAEPTLTQALKILDQLLKVQTEQQSHVASDMIFTLSILTQNLMRHGTNTQEVQQRAQQIYDQTMLSENLMISEQTGLINNMAQIYWLELFQLFHQDQNILPKAEQLLAFLNPAENLQKKDPLQLVTLANTHLMIAAYNQRQQQTTTFHLNRAENFLNLAQQINPNNPALLLSLGTLQTLESSSGDMNYVRANRTFSQAINNSNNIYSHNSWAQALIIQAQYSQNKIQQDQALETAHLHIEQALSIDPNNQVFIHTQSKLQALAAELSSARD